MSNQCTGAPAYQDDTDNDPIDNADCDSGTFGGEPTTAGQNVRIAELQVFSGSALDPPGNSYSFLRQHVDLRIDMLF